jgi:hypothetical protein
MEPHLMDSIRIALIARPRLILGIAATILALTFVAPLYAAGGNFVTIYDAPFGRCWHDNYRNSGNGSDRAEEAAAGSANTAYGTYVGVRSEGGVRQIISCGT